MIDSWNAAKLNERINQVEKKIQANDVIANPTGAATVDLSKVSIDGTVYGTSVVKANPVGEASGDLTKVSVNGTVYGIPNSDIVFDTLTETDFTYDSVGKVYNAEYTIPTGKSIIGITAYTLNSANILGVRWNSGTGVLTVSSSPTFISEAFTFVITIILK